MHTRLRRGGLAVAAGLLSLSSLTFLGTQLAGGTQPVEDVSYDTGNVKVSGPVRNASCSVTTDFHNEGNAPVAITVNQSIAGDGGWVWFLPPGDLDEFTFGATETIFVIEPGETARLAVYDSRVTAPFQFREGVGPWFTRDINSNGRCDDGTTTSAPTTSTTEEPTTTTEAPTTTQPEPTTTVPGPTTTVPTPTTAPPVFQTVTCPAGSYVRLTFSGELPAVAVITYNGLTVHASSAIAQWITTLPISTDVVIQVLSEGVVADCPFIETTTTLAPAVRSAGITGGGSDVPGALLVREELPFTAGKPVPWWMSPHIAIVFLAAGSGLVVACTDQGRALVRYIASRR